MIITIDEDMNMIVKKDNEEISTMIHNETLEELIYEIAILFRKRSGK